MRHRGFRQQLDRFVVQDVEVVAVDPSDAAMSVAHVFTETNVRHDDEPGTLRFDRAHRLLDDAVLSMRAAGRFVLLARNAKEQHRLQTKIVGALRFIGYVCERQLENSRAQNATLETWTARRRELREEFLKGAGLWPLPERKPARTVSGDYYDFLPLGDEKLGIAVGDISGKGISAALLASIITAVHPPPRKQGPLLLWSVAAYAAATVVYGVSHNFLLTLFALAGSGAADLVSTVIRSTVRQVLTPDELRGRITAFNMIFFIGGPQLGEMEAGFVASLFSSAAFGTIFSIASGGAATLLLVGLVALFAPVLRNYELGKTDSTPSTLSHG